MSPKLVNSTAGASVWKRRLLSVLASCWLIFAAPWVFAQTCSIPGNSGAASIATQPNTFFPGLLNPAINATSLTVSGGTGTNSPILAGDLLLIIQMQGADIDATDTNAYGDATTNAGVTNTVAFGVAGYAGGVNGTNFVAGNYEWAVATGGGATFAAGGTINLSAPLTRGYFTRTGSVTQGKQAYQVIRVPQYSNLTVTAGLTVVPWNGFRGGVLVLEATGDINLGTQVINGSGRGFRGAGGVQDAVNGTCTAAYNTTGCQSYRALIADNLGGSKGEGSAGTPSRIYIEDPTGAGTGISVNGAGNGYVNGESSRGAPGNAGGGGNQHNAGGGGGGNGGAGGRGGNTWNSSVPTFAGLFLGGFGGSPSGNAAARWIMGGGGGAGDRNDSGVNQAASGGAGGALVILRASRIVTTGAGATINTNGAPGINNGGATDAAGGGGAGGTVILAAGTGGLNGVLTVNALGGAGGPYLAAVDEQDGAGAGGGGGVLISNLAVAPTFNAAGGAAGTSASNSCPPFRAAADCGQTAGVATAGLTGYAITSPGVQVGYECLPSLTVTKTTLTPTITTTAGATADYSIAVVNNGGGARFVSVFDIALPPGWTLAAPVPTYQYFPAQPLVAGRLSSGAETAAIATSRTWVVAATPLTVPGAGQNSPTWASFAIAPIVAGVPSVVTVTFRVSIPNTATVGTYHNGAGITFLDPTRPSSTRTVSPLTAVNANRTATAYSANTTYANFNGAATTNVGGSNYNGLVAGSNTEDVRLLPDFRISKTAPATAATNTTFNYTITPSNNGRAIAAQVFATTQATDATAGALGSSPLTITDTLPTGVLATNTFSGTNWSCSGTAPVVCTLPDTNAYPIAAATNFPVVTGTVRITCTGGNVKTNTVVISPGAGETLLTNNTGTVTTTVTPACVNATLTVSKINAGTTLFAGQTTSYTITIANLGPGAAGGTTLLDPVAPGLSCTTNPTCAVTGGLAVCPAPLTIGTLQSPGFVISTFPAASSLTFVLTCGVTATGL